MPHVDVDGLTINYDVQGEGEPLLLIPYLSADHACWAFQLPAYTEHFSCIAIDLPGTGESDKPPGPYSTHGHADQVAAFSVPSARPLPSTWPRAIPPASAHSPCTAAGTPATTI
jgi:pimeloyl-ACP methyl ester carboxylesterase